MVRGNSLAGHLAISTSSQAVAETEAFATLKIIRRLLRADHQCAPPSNIMPSMLHAGVAMTSVLSICCTVFSRCTLGTCDPAKHTMWHAVLLTLRWQPDSIHVYQVSPCEMTALCIPVMWSDCVAASLLGIRFHHEQCNGHISSSSFRSIENHKPQKDMDKTVYRLS